MQINKRWLLLVAVAVSTVFGAAVASRSRSPHRGTAPDRELKAELKSWENEGGNLAPAPERSVLP